MNIGRYRVEHRLGEGPRGVVYKGHDADGPHGPLSPVAIKVLHAHVCTDPNLERHCQDLQQSLRNLGHDAIPRPAGVGMLPDGRVYLVSEYVAGQPLANRLRDGGALPALTALHVAKALAAVLDAAQKQNLYHLALKPTNVLLVSDPAVPGGERVKLLDLGLASLVPLPPGSEAAGLSYQAPEQLSDGSQGDGQADVYALGNVFYEMLSGKPRRRGERGQMLSVPPVPPTTIKQIYPVLYREMTALLQLMRQPDPKQRPLMSQVASRLAQLEEDMLIGETIGPYRVVSRLAQGGMSTVFRAINEQIGRQVAIKVMRSRYMGNASVRDRFLNEARVANLARHPALVQIYEFGELPGGRPYLVMELIEGESLRARRERAGGTLPEAEALRLMHLVAECVAATQQQGVYHLDLKPDNIMVLSGPEGERVKLLDFGTARPLQVPAETDLSDSRTDTEAGMGTPNYMAPEQFGGAHAVTDRTDVYAIGVMLYELLAGRRPYAQPGFAPMSEPHRPLAKAAPSVSAATARLVEQMLSYRPADRPRLPEVVERLGTLARGAVLPECGQASSAVTLPMAPAPQARSEARRPSAYGLVLAAGALCILAFVAGRLTARIGAAEPALTASAGGAVQMGPEQAPAPRPPSAQEPPVAVLPEPADRRVGFSEATSTPVRSLDLQALRQEADSVLRQALEHRDATVRRRAAAVAGRLGRTGAARHREAIEALLDDPDLGVQRYAAQSLGQLGMRESVPALKAFVGRTRDPYAFVAAADALARLQDEEGRRRLREAMHARDAGVRLEAATLLASLGEAEAAARVPALLSAAGIPPRVRVRALELVARMGNAQARVQLGQLAESHHEDPETRASAAEALARVGEERGYAFLLTLLERPPALSMPAVWALADLQGTSSCASLPDLPPEGPAARLLAAAVLGCGAPNDAPRLAMLMQTPEVEQRLAAAAGLMLLAQSEPPWQGK
ncbi:MAG: protein kinase [Myxococcales bacterium]|nr:protein kinase [Myxococcota bacterium]MDW8282232.1 protein kinase [Myxococcales bacterium]